MNDAIGNSASSEGTILVCAAMGGREAHDGVVEYLRAHARPGVRIVGGLDDAGRGGVDWDRVRVAEGGWEAAYAWAARSHDAIAVVPVDGGDGLSRGVASIAMAALALVRPVLLVRDGSAWQADRVEVVNEREYRGVYARAVVRPIDKAVA